MRAKAYQRLLTLYSYCRRQLREERRLRVFKNRIMRRRIWERWESVFGVGLHRTEVNRDNSEADLVLHGQWYHAIPLLVGIFYIYYSDNMLFIMNTFYMRNLYLYLRIILAFLIMIPIFIVHLWLPKAHVEAPK